MDQHSALNRYGTMLMAASMAIALFVATQAIAGPDHGIASRYAAWAGGRHNADALVNGMKNGSSITLVTLSPKGSRSVAGFTPPARMSADEVSAALTGAQRTLARLGIQRPSADQIQAALVGGEVSLASGRTRLVQGSLPASSGETTRQLALVR